MREDDTDFFGKRDQDREDHFHLETTIVFKRLRVKGTVGSTNDSHVTSGCQCLEKEIRWLKTWLRRRMRRRCVNGCEREGLVCKGVCERECGV